MVSFDLKSPSVIAALYLQGWFWANVVITLYSKAVFSVYKFPYPLLMTAIHMAFTSAGVWIAAATKMYDPKPLSPEAWRHMLWFSVVFSVNIWMSNASLMAVSVNLHQVVRTTIPLFTVWVSAAFFKTKYPASVLAPIVVIMVGVGFTVKGELDFAWAPFALVVFGSLVAALKGIVTQQSQVGSLGLGALDMLRAVSPLATVQLLLLSMGFGETKQLLASGDLSAPLVGHLVANGFIALFLNVVSFRTAALVSPLTMNVTGNIKQVLTCVFSVVLFNGSFNTALVVGILTTSLGAFWYAQEMRAHKNAGKTQKEKNDLPLPVTQKDAEQNNTAKASLSVKEIEMTAAGSEAASKSAAQEGADVAAGGGKASELSKD